MAMDIELRNALGALTAQVQELTKQSKTLDTTLSTALDKSTKAAGGLTESAKKTHTEMSIVEQVTQRLGRSWANQMFSLASGAIGVTAIWSAVSNKINEAMENAEKRAKSVRDFADKSRPVAPPPILPELRQSIYKNTPNIKPEESAEALRAYLMAGGSSEKAEVERFGRVVNAYSIMGFTDAKDLASQYATIRKMGVSNPEDAILAMAKSGKTNDLGKLKPGEARALATKNKGAWSRSLADAKIMAPEDYESWAEKAKETEARRAELEKGMQQARAAARLSKLRDLLQDDSVGTGLNRYNLTGLDGLSLSLGDINRIKKTWPGRSGADIASMLDLMITKHGAVPDAELDNLPVNPQPVSPPPAAEPAAPSPIVPPPHWSTMVPRAVAPPAAAPRQVVEVRIVGDSRPVPVNAGE
jgi:hypothetical protein